MTLDDLERPLRTPFQNACVFGAHHENLNKDAISEEDAAGDSSFWQYKVYADIHGVPWTGGVKRQWETHNTQLRITRFCVLFARVSCLEWNSLLSIYSS